ILLGLQLVQIRLTAGLELLMELLQKGDAPATAGPRSTALRELTGNPGTLDAQEVEQLPAADVEAVADFLIEDLVRALRHRGPLHSPKCRPFPIILKVGRVAEGGWVGCRFGPGF